MERRTIETSQGEVWVWGSESDLLGPDALVVCVTGAFAGPNACRPWREALGLPMVVIDLPGNRCPWLKSQHPGAYCAAISEVVASLSRPVTLCGVSTGGLVALGAKAPNLKWTLALDPMLSTSLMTKLWRGFRQKMREDRSPELAAFMFAFFGLSEKPEVEPRHHHEVLFGRLAPAWIIGGDRVSEQPGILSPHDEAVARGADNVRFTKVMGVGHHITEGAASIVLDALRMGPYQQDQNTAKAT